MIEVFYFKSIKIKLQFTLQITICLFIIKKLIVNNFNTSKLNIKILIILKINLYKLIILLVVIKNQYKALL